MDLRRFIKENNSDFQLTKRYLVVVVKVKRLKELRILLYSNFSINFDGETTLLSFEKICS